MKEVNCFNKEAALEGLAQDEDLLREVIGTFLNESPNMIQSIGTAIHQQNAYELEKAAHTLKGAASYLRADEVSDTCYDLEKLGQKHSFQQAEEIYGKLKSAMDHLTNELSTFG